ncbi:hypothetical protein V6N13_096763 [Hibiscus sabdariffa]
MRREKGVSVGSAMVKPRRGVNPSVHNGAQDILQRKITGPGQEPLSSNSKLHPKDDKCEMACEAAQNRGRHPVDVSKGESTQPM